jgi:ABC-2 type transport system permease protein
VSAISASGLLPLYRRRLAVTGKTVSGVVGWLVAPTLWILVVGPALDAALGSFDPNVDFFSYISVGQAAFLIPFDSMASAITVIVDSQFGVMREFLVAPIRRAIIPLANALGVLTIAWCRSSSSSSLLSRVESTSKASPAGLGWFTAAAVLL